VLDTLEVLRQGPAINPSPAARTRMNEELLAIAPPCVYAYLGRTDELFGNAALSLPIEGLTGTVSPFDTGGLVRHIVPVKDWPADHRRSFLAHYSWPTDNLQALLTAYPTTGAPQRRAYLNSDRPHAAGPHEVWPTAEEPFVASIWTEPNEWRSWLWEGRSPHQLSIQQNLVAWSCSAPTYGEILKHIEEVADAADVGWLETLLQKYVDGGVSALVQNLRDAQEVA
jgi:hypothetical protein